MPAAFTTRSGASPPSTSTTYSARRFTLPGSETSAGTACPPTSAAASRNAASPRATIATQAPASQKRAAIARPIPREAPVTSAVCPASTPFSAAEPMRRRQPQELLARAKILQEDAPHRTRDRLRVLLLHAPHHHAEVVRLDHHAHALRLEDVPDRLRDLVRHPLLHLEPPGEHLHDPGELRESHDPPVRNVRDVHLPEERQQVVLAERVHLDVPDHHHVLVVLFEDPLADDLLDREVVAPRQPLENLLHPLGRPAQPLPIRILAQPPHDLRNQVPERYVAQIDRTHPTLRSTRTQAHARSSTIAITPETLRSPLCAGPCAS